MALPFVVLILVLLILDFRGAVSSMPVILRNLGGFVAFLLLLGLIGMWRISLVLHDGGLTVHYPFHSRTISWLELQHIQIARAALFRIPMIDVLYFIIDGERVGSILSSFGLPSEEIVTLCGERQYAARHPPELLQSAQDEALELNHDYLGSEHLLLAIAGSAPSPAARVLTRLGVSRVGLTAAIAARVAPSETRVSAPLACDDSANRALEYALSEARRRGEKWVEAEHVLLGILAQPGSIAVNSLQSVGLSAVTLRAAVIGEIGAYPGRIEFEGTVRSAMCRVLYQAAPWTMGIICGLATNTLTLLLAWLVASEWRAFDIRLVFLFGIAPFFFFLYGYSRLARRRDAWPVESQSGRVWLSALAATMFALGTYLSFLMVSYSWHKERLPPEKQDTIYLVLHPDAIPDLRIENGRRRNGRERTQSWTFVTIAAFGVGGFIGYRIAKHGFY